MADLKTHLRIDWDDDDADIQDFAWVAYEWTTRRELFVPEEFAARAYEDTALPIGEEQTISQPYIVALPSASHPEALLLGQSCFPCSA